MYLFKFSFLYSILNPLIEDRIKQQIENLIMEKLKSAVEHVQENIKRLRSNVSELQQSTNVIMNTVTDDKENQQNDQEKLKTKEVWESVAFNSDTTIDTKGSTIHDRELFPMEE